MHMHTHTYTHAHTTVKRYAHSHTDNNPCVHPTPHPPTPRKCTHRNCHKDKTEKLQSLNFRGKIGLWQHPSDMLGCGKSSAFFFCIPSCISGVHHFGWDFCIRDRFFNLINEAGTFCLRGWCMLGVFLLQAFTHLGHERQDHLSLCDEKHVCID